MNRAMASAKLLALILICASPGVWVPVQAAEADPRELVGRFVDAWNTHATASFGKLVAEDVDWVTASGVRLKGRDRIQEFLANEHATWARTTTMRAVSIRTRELDEDSTIVMFEWEIATPAAKDVALSVARGNNLFVASRVNGEWLIVAGQVARARQ